MLRALGCRPQDRSRGLGVAKAGDAVVRRPPPQAVTSKLKAATARTATRPVVALVTGLVWRSCGQPGTVQDRCVPRHHTRVGGSASRLQPAT